MTQKEQCMTGQVQLTEAIVLASHASRSTQLGPGEARCLPPRQCKFATRPMNVQCLVFCSCSAFFVQVLSLLLSEKKTIGLASKNLTKILTNLLK